MINRFEIQITSGPVHIGGHGLKEWRTFAYCEVTGQAQQVANIDPDKIRVLDTITKKWIQPSRPGVVINFPVAVIG